MYAAILVTQQINQWQCESELSAAVNVQSPDDTTDLCDCSDTAYLPLCSCITTETAH
jgi:hypothetical protein